MRTKVIGELFNQKLVSSLEFCFCKSVELLSFQNSWRDLNVCCNNYETICLFSTTIRKCDAGLLPAMPSNHSQPFSEKFNQQKLLISNGHNKRTINYLPTLFCGLNLKSHEFWWVALVYGFKFAVHSMCLWPNKPSTPVFALFWRCLNSKSDYVEL